MTRGVEVVTRPASHGRAPPPTRSGRPSRPRRRRPGRALLVAAVVVSVAAVGLFKLVAVRPALPRGQSAGGEALDPDAFASGACVAFEPTHGDRHLTVFLDAGHGGIDPGGVGETANGSTVEESSVNLAIELEATRLLRAAGYRVVDSRTAQTTVTRLSAADTDDGVLSLQGSHDDVVARDRCANLAGAAVLVGIYMDAGASQQDAGSVSIYDADRPFATENQALADLLQDDVLAAMNAQGWQIPDNGVQDDTTFGSSVGNPDSGGLAAQAAAYDHLLLIGPAQAGYFSNPSTMPGAVIEPLYLTDPFEASIAASATGQQVIAGGLMRAIERFTTPHAKAS